MKMGSRKSSTPFSDKINDNQLEYDNKMTDCETLDIILLNLLNGNPNNTPEKDLWVILTLKEKMDTLGLRITNEARKTIHSHHEQVISIFKRVNITPTTSQTDIEKVAFISEKLDSPAKSEENFDEKQLNLCLKEMMFHKITDIPRAVIDDFRYALLSKRESIRASFENTLRTIRADFANEDEKNKRHRLTFASSIEGILYFESTYVACQGKLDILNLNWGKIRFGDKKYAMKNKKYVESFEDSIKRGRLPNESTLNGIDKIINEIKQSPEYEPDKLKMLSSPSLLNSYPKKIVPTSSLPNFPTNPKTLLEAILNDAIQRVKKIPGVNEDIATHFTNYKNTVLKAFEEKDFEDSLNEIYQKTKLSLLTIFDKEVSTIELTKEIDALNDDVITFYKNQKQNSRKKIKQSKK